VSAGHSSNRLLVQRLTPASRSKSAGHHDNGAFSITFIQDGTDKQLRLLRRDEVFDDAVRAIPLLADWIDSSRAQPGDAVCTTTPLAGRGVTLALMQAPGTHPHP
jgi:hypothetical protein